MSVQKQMYYLSPRFLHIYLDIAKKLSRVSPYPAIQLAVFIAFSLNIISLSSALAQQASLEVEQSASASLLQSQTNPFPNNYILGPGDHVAIEVFEYEEFTASKVILPDGTISLPLVGAIPAAGQTSDSLERLLTDELSNYLVNPVVSVSLTILRPVVVTVSGEVQRPGPVQLRSLTTTNDFGNGFNDINSATDDTLDGAPTVSSALIQAGGITQNADIRQVMVRRSRSASDSVTTNINLWDAVWSDNAVQDLVLQDGDSIFVPRLAAGETLDRRLIARSTLAPSVVRVRVVGEVVRPGEVQVPPDSSLSSAVAIAGGPTNDAKLSEVEFVRLNEQGQIEYQEVDLRNLVDDFQIQEGDVVIVPRKGSAAFFDVASRLFAPLNLFRGVVDILDNN